MYSKRIKIDSQGLKIDFQIPKIDRHWTIMQNWVAESKSTPKGPKSTSRDQKYIQAPNRLLEVQNRLADVQNHLSLAPSQSSETQNGQLGVKYPKPQNWIPDVDFVSLGANFSIVWVDMRDVFLSYFGIIDLGRRKINFLSPNLLLDACEHFWHLLLCSTTHTKVYKIYTIL